VGCCSLRREHLRFPSDHEVEFDFLGKDSMRYHQIIDVSGHAVSTMTCCTVWHVRHLFAFPLPLSQFTRYGEIGRLVCRNLRKLCKDKKPEEQVLDTLTVRATPVRCRACIATSTPPLSPPTCCSRRG